MNPTPYRKPDFLIIGAQKAGTTWLWRMIDEHPNSDLPSKKEIHYFGSSELYNLGKDWYFNHFSGIDLQKITGEASTTYFFNKVPFWHNKGRDLIYDDFLPSIPELINQELPNVKIIAVLRNPVKRAISAYHHLMKRAAIEQLDYDRGMSPAISIEKTGKRFPKKRILEYGFYSEYLTKWMEIIPQERMKIFIFEDDIISAPERTVAETYRFLGIDDNFYPAKLHVPANKSWGWTRILAAFYLPSFFSKMIKYRLGSALDRFNVLESFSVRSDDIAFLKSVYAEEKNALESLLGRKISWDI